MTLCPCSSVPDGEDGVALTERAQLRSRRRPAAQTLPAALAPAGRATRVLRAAPHTSFCALVTDSLASVKVCDVASMRRLQYSLCGTDVPGVTALLSSPF